MKHTGFIIIMFMGISALIALVSCADKAAALKSETAALAEELNNEFVSVRLECERLAAMAKELLLTKDSYTKTMADYDMEKGGFMKWFNGYYLKYIDAGNSQIIVTEHDTMNKTTFFPHESTLIEARLLYDNLIENMEDFYKSKNYFAYINYIQYCLDSTIAIEYPYYDAASALPNATVVLQAFNGDMRAAIYYSICNKQKNPDKKTIWMPDLWIHGTAAGVTTAAFTPIYLNDDDEMYARITIGIKMEKLSDTFLKDKESLLLLTTSSGNICGASDAAVDELGIQLPYWYYLTQLKINELGDTFKFKSYEDVGIQALGEKALSGETGFEVAIKDRIYLVCVEDLPEVNYKLIGLVEK